MGAELAAAIAFGLLATIIGAVQIWLTWKRRTEDAPAPTAVNPNAQPLREEAVTALMDAIMGVDSLEPMSVRSVEDVRQAVESQRRELDRLRSRLRITQGIGEGEVEAFTKAAQAVVDLEHVLKELSFRHVDEFEGAITHDDLKPEINAITMRALGAYEAIQGFEEAAREAATR